MKHLFLLLIAVVCLTDTNAQDQHFSQLYAAPLALNPALTGAYDGRYRFSGIYRDQWRGALENPYVTFAGMLDVRFPLEFYSGKYKDAAAVGLMFYNDKVTGIDFNTNQIAISGAYHKALDQNSTQYLSIGIQGGLAQRNVNYEDLRFDDQYNGTTGYVDPTSERLPSNNFAFSDFAFGINYAYSPKRFTSLFLGFAMHHVFEPQVTFYELDDNSNYQGSQLHRKLSLQISGSIPLGNKVALLPRVLAAQQGPHLRMNGGTNIRFLINDYSGTALHFGTWLRPVGNADDNITIDALIFMAGFEFNNVLLGLSYDANFTALTATRTGQGAFEVSVAYLGDYENVTVLCPKF